jgi:hypothetical protein
MAYYMAFLSSSSGICVLFEFVLSSGENNTLRGHATSTVVRAVLERVTLVPVGTVGSVRSVRSRDAPHFSWGGIP